MSSLAFSKPLRADNIETVPSAPGVYVWRKAASDKGFLDAKMSDDPDKIRQWLLQRLGSGFARWTSAELKAKGLRPGFISFENLSIGEPDKRSLSKSLSRLSKSELVEICHILLLAGEQFGPVVYVGQTEDLRKRAREHIAGGSNLKTRLENSDYDFDDLTFSYLVIDSESDIQSELISSAELIIGNASAAFCSERLG